MPRFNHRQTLSITKHFHPVVRWVMGVWMGGYIFRPGYFHFSEMVRWLRSTYE